MFLSFFNVVTAIVSILLVIWSIKIFFLATPWGMHFPRLRNFLARYRTMLGAVITIVSVFGSLYYSEIMHYEPCPLCWWQRMFIYASAVVLLVAWARKKNDAYQYVLWLSLAGIVFAINNLLLIWFPGAGIACDAVELCTKLYVNTFGFVTIPFMSFSVLLFLISLSFIKNSNVPEIENA